MSQHHLLLLLLGLWTLGWIAFLIIDWGRGQLYHQARDQDGSFQDFLIRLLIHFFWWPFVIAPAFSQFLFYWDVRRGKQPSWQLYNKGEDPSRKWNLPGEVFSVTASSFEGNLRISGYFRNGNGEREVECRVAMLVPQRSNFGGWKKLQFVRREDRLAFEDGEKDEDGFDCYELNLRVDEGKHQVEFRIPDFEVSEPLTIQVIAARLGSKVSE